MVGWFSNIPDHIDNRGFWLTPKEQGRGVMTEASAVATRFWFIDMNQPLLRTSKAIKNTPSRKISLKEGMRVVETLDIEYVEGLLKSEIWEITREEWQARP